MIICWEEKHMLYTSIAFQRKTHTKYMFWQIKTVLKLKIMDLVVALSNSNQYRLDKKMNRALCHRQINIWLSQPRCE